MKLTTIGTGSLQLEGAEVSLSTTFKVGMKLSIKVPHTQSFHTATIRRKGGSTVLLETSDERKFRVNLSESELDFHVLEGEDEVNSSKGTFISDCSNLLYVTPN